MTTVELVKEQVHALMDLLPEPKLLTLLDFAQYLAEREREGDWLQAQMQSTAYQEWVGTDNDVYDEILAQGLDPSTIGEAVCGWNAGRRRLFAQCPGIVGIHGKRQ